MARSSTGIGQISNLSVAEHIRHKRLVPLLLQHMSEHIGVHLYHGRRAAQPPRVRAFIDLAVQRLLDSPRYLVTKAELREAHAGFRRARHRRRHTWRGRPR
jgi:DNA-binding transcriptional LysR family regulator